MDIRAADEGDISAVALMGTDIERIASDMRLLHEIWGSLLDIAIACWLLERQLFLACLAPIALVLGISRVPPSSLGALHILMLVPQSSSP